MEHTYKKDYRKIGFRVIFTQIPDQRWILGFAAQPYESLLPEMDNDPNYFMFRGRIEIGGKIMMGFTEFRFEMTDELHERLGELYKKLRLEYRNKILTKT
ncbi:MAG: hypothetical protein AAFU57_08105 [Bacteroidota bacterium]